MSGAVIANEIRGIAGGLVGKRLQPVQVTDLMIDTDKGRDRAPRSGSSRGKVHDDTRAAQNYYKAWSRSIEAKLKEADGTTKPKRVSKHKR